MKRFYSLCIALYCFSSVHAQEAHDSKIIPKYKGVIDIESGVAYNINTAQLISTNNMQALYCITTTHGVQIKNVFVGAGLGYYHSIRDKENIYPFFAATRFTFPKIIIKPFVELRAGMAYDPHWISSVQYYGALNCGFNVLKKIQLGCRVSMFSRPSRYFTVNASIVCGVEF